MAFPNPYATKVPNRVLSHAQRVKLLYKSSRRSIESYWKRYAVHEEPGNHYSKKGISGYSWKFENSHLNQRFELAKLRKRFDDNMCIDDPLEARKLLIAGEKRLFELAPRIPIRFPYSPDGTEYKRQPFNPDWMLDMQHPYQKAQYPEYFARREVRKKEFVDRWLKKYGKEEAETAV